MTPLSCAELNSMGRNISTPFYLSLSQVPKGQDILKIESILRLVPGRRLVALAQWNGKQVIAKLFFHARHFKRNMRRDLEGINQLIQSDIPTPALLMQGLMEDQRGGVLITEYLHHGTPLAVLFDNADSETTKDEVMSLAIKLIAQCHQSGICQSDIHLDNFMRWGERVYLLDGGGIVSEEGGLDSKARLQNLALFFAQFSIAGDEKITSLLQIYQNHTSVISDNDNAGFHEQVKLARRQRLSKFERKLFRSTSASGSERSIRKFCVYDRSIYSPELERFIENPDAYIKPENMLKKGNSSTVALVKIDDRDYVLKRYNIKNFWHGLSRSCRPSRAHHSWRNASVLEMLGIGTAHPYLFIEERLFWIFRRRAYFLCERVLGEDLGTQWKNANLINEQKENLVQDKFKEVADLFRQLFERMSDYRISHGDMKATNFIIRDKQLVVLDLDSMKRHKSLNTFQRSIEADLVRFQKNWINSSLELPVKNMCEQIEQYRAG
ncbi:MAG: hypothetical protein COA96_07375 [SAR86 cluster bacterium]|uniref:Protein kinase domain-containing protein n=1 Tax=SAR86 cluster bacterium TaxID=2030880 RepID=A0A2A5B1K5_9GAMM|nr:MAG: hypothetical protein COA96_07375 [SAR86 cluster bacterium]